MNEKLYKAWHEKNALQRYVARRFLFAPLQRLGFHVTGDHFYEIVPNTRQVAAQYSAAPRELSGLDWPFAAAEQRLLRLLAAYGAEYLAASRRHGFREKNHYFRGLDALALYLMVRDARPAKIVEIGQGFSSRIILAALEHNAAATGEATEFITIDPYARWTPADLPRQVTLRIVRQQLQAVELAPLLAGCRFLFVDSSHVFKFGSDVAYEFNQVYPRLPPDTILHLHDIFTPYDYPLDWIVRQKRFWNEQYLLESFLMFSRAFEVVLPMNALARQSAACAAAVRTLPLDEDFEYAGSSFYLRRI